MKQALATAILLFAGLWPLAHRGIVAAYEVSPWKLGGFAMYTTPTPPVQVVLFERGGAGLVPIDERQLAAPLRSRIDRFRAERHALGRLRRPDELGAALLEARPELDWVVVAVQRMELDRATARMASRREEFVYERTR